MVDPNENARSCEWLLNCRRALFVGAHPDDIEFRAGGLVYLMRKRGVDVTYAIATRGGRGWPTLLRRPLEAIRQRQQRNAAALLGVTNLIFFDYPDSDLSAYVTPLAQDISEAIDHLKPDVVLCWDPEFIFTAHPDHQAAADATQAACGEVSTCWYGTAQPNVWVGMDEEALQAKIRALKAHRTETPWFYFDLRQKKRMIAAMRENGARIGSKYAEGFRISQPRR
jgi:LmbE family N-acetylglucosaminyl deacetylase